MTYNSFSLKIVEVFNSILEISIAHKKFIESFELYYVRTATNGNDCINIHYIWKLNKGFWRLPLTEQEMIKADFEESRTIVFSLYSRTNRGYYNQLHILARLLEFKHIYLNLTLFLTAQLEKHLPDNTPIKIKEIDHWPKLNCAEKYFEKLKDERIGYADLLHSSYEEDVFQYSSLHRLNLNSKRLYNEDSLAFTITDYELLPFFSEDLNKVRSMLIDYDIPIKIKGFRTIREIYIHVNTLAKVLVRLSAESSKTRDYELALDFIYSFLSIDEKENIISQLRLEFIEGYPIQRGDLLELKDGRLVIAQSIIFSQDSTLNIEYNILKVNLEESIRKRMVKVENVDYYLKAIDFEKYKSQNLVKRLSLLKRWMHQRKLKAVLPSFSLI